MIHVCMPLHDKHGTYSKYEGVAINSLFYNTKEAVTVHIIHDETLSSTQKQKFNKLADRYEQKIKFWRLNGDEYASYEKIAKFYTIGTLFRLSVCDVLPESIDKVIFLDADIIVNIDIKSLWDMDISNYPLAAAKDFGVKELGGDPWPCRVGKVRYENYFNVGILILNLQYLRNNIALKDSCLEYIVDNPQSSFLDNDALNVFFSEKYLELDGKYNLISKIIRKNNLPEQQCIIHFAGDYVNVESPQWWDMLFIKYWKESPWADEMADYFLKVLSLKKCQCDIYRTLLAELLITRKKIIIWGINSILWNNISDIITIDKTIDYAVDNNASLWGEVVKTLVVQRPEALLSESKDSVIVIVLSLQYYSDIKKQLEEYGFIENEHFFNGQMMLTQDKGGICGYF